MAARQAHGTHMAKDGPPPQLAAAGIRFCAMKPPTLPMTLMPAITAAACAPGKSRTGNVQNSAINTEMQGVPKNSAA